MMITTPAQQRAPPISMCLLNFFAVCWVVIICVPAAAASPKPETGQPHFGQFGANDEICDLHSGQEIKLMSIRYL
jgi:hypothetical protein